MVTSKLRALVHLADRRITEGIWNLFSVILRQRVNQKDSACAIALPKSDCAEEPRVLWPHWLTRIPRAPGIHIALWNHEPPNQQRRGIVPNISNSIQIMLLSSMQRALTDMPQLQWRFVGFLLYLMLSSCARLGV